MATDPVCGMEFKETSASPTAEYQDQRFYFCSNDCLKEFEADPEIWQPAFKSMCGAGETADGKARVQASVDSASR